MPRQPIYFDQDVLDRLKKYTKSKFGNRRVLSAVVQRAVIKFLDAKEEKKDAKNKQRKGSI